MTRRRTTAVAGVVTAAALLGAPAASAGHERADCGFHSVSVAEVTGPDTYDGFAYGYVAAPGDTTTIRCEVRVNGVAVSTTPASPALPNAAATAGRVTFVATENDFVLICAVYTTRHQQATCDYPVPPEWPPSEVWDALNLAYDQVEPVLCDTFKALSPGAGPVHVNEQGDVYVAGEPQWDCPPYDIWPLS